MNYEMKRRITLFVLKEHAERLCEKIMEIKKIGQFKLYVGDLKTYTMQLLIDNGWSIYSDSIYDVLDILKAVLVYCFSNTGVDGDCEWSDDKDYVFVNCKAIDSM